jgi:hypothetical protein
MSNLTNSWTPALACAIFLALAACGTESGDRIEAACQASCDQHAQCWSDSFDESYDSLDQCQEECEEGLEDYYEDYQPAACVEADLLVQICVDSLDCDAVAEGEYDRCDREYDHLSDCLQRASSHLEEENFWNPDQHPEYDQ